jgi:hypothetical protein
VVGRTPGIIVLTPAEVAALDPSTPIVEVEVLAAVPRDAPSG